MAAPRGKDSERSLAKALASKAPNGSHAWRPLCRPLPRSLDFSPLYQEKALLQHLPTSLRHRLR